LRERAAPLDERKRNGFSRLHDLILRRRITRARKTICRTPNTKNVSVRSSPDAKASIILHVGMISARVARLGPEHCIEMQKSSSQLRRHGDATRNAELKN